MILAYLFFPVSFAMAPLFHPALIKSSSISRPVQVRASEKKATIKEDKADLVVIYLEANTKISISGVFNQLFISHFSTF